MEVDQAQNEENKAAVENVLFEPAIYAPQAEEADDAMADDNISSRTNPGAAGPEFSGKAIDPSLLQAATVRCCICGIMTHANAANTCINCLKSQIDITEGIPKSLILHHCRDCNRYQRPPWTLCELESAELLAICLKNIKGLKRVKLLDAAFIWTEPHSRRIKVKLTVQKEVQTNTMLQQTFQIEFTVQNLQCDDCKQTYTPHTWQAQVQLRQRVHHKKTFLYLEQLILRHDAAGKTIAIREVHDGLDFQYKQQSHSNRIISFVMNNFVARHKSSRQLISHDEQSGDSKYKYSNILELAPICKEDLVILPPKLMKVLGGIGPLILVYKITTAIHIVDIHTMRTHEIDSTHYWKHMFKACATRDRLTRFVVLNVEEIDFDVNTSRAAAKNKFRMVRLELARESEFGVNDRSFIVNTHLGEFINYNDTVWGYDLDQMTLNDLDEYELDRKMNKHQLPDVVVVKKAYPRLNKRHRQRIWKLKRFQTENPAGDNNVHAMKKKSMKDARQAEEREQKDYKEFLQDIEEDPEMRGNINLYKDDDVIQQLEAQLNSLSITEGPSAGKSPQDAALEAGQVQMGSNMRKVVKAKRTTETSAKEQAKQEALRKKDADLFKASMQKKKVQAAKEAALAENEDSDWESVEEDFPHVKLSELLDGLTLEVNGGGDDSDEEDVAVPNGVPMEEEKKQ